jgi:hypothetical protein
MGKILAPFRKYKIDRLGNVTIPTLISSAGNSQNYVFSEMDDIYFEAEIYLNSYNMVNPIIEASSTANFIMNEFAFAISDVTEVGNRSIPQGAFFVYNGTRGASLSCYYTNSVIVNLNTWTKVAAERKNNNWKLFINNIECSVSRVTDPGIPDDRFGNENLTVYIGKSEAGNQDFDGQIRNVILGNKLVNNKISIKKQNLTKLKSGIFYNANESYYIFRSATNNTLAQIFSANQFEAYADSLSVYDINFNPLSLNNGGGNGLFTDGSSWIYDDFSTNADNYVIPANTVLVFSTTINFDINAGGGAIIQKYYSGKINLNLYYPDDSDARNYILAVEAVEGPLEVGVKKAINNFIVGCKSDGIWTAIKASCLLAGPKTLNGILVPLVGTAPTNINFISSDYNRKTGLKGDGSTKYLDSNRSNSADPQNSKHVSAYLTESPTRDATRSMIAVDTAPSNLFLGTTITSVFFRINFEFTTPTSFVDSNLILGLFGGSRNLSSNVNTRYNQNNGTLANTSINPSSTNIYIFSRQTLTNYSNARITFYSIGENIDLEKLENRVKTYVDTLSTLPI